MAEVLKFFDFKNGKRNVKQLPWGVLLDGKIRRLVQGRDFSAKMTSFRTALYRQAKAHGKKILSSLEDNETLVIQAYDMEDTD